MKNLITEIENYIKIYDKDKEMHKFPKMNVDSNDRNHIITLRHQIDREIKLFNDIDLVFVNNIKRAILMYKRRTGG